MRKTSGLQAAAYSSVDDLQRALLQNIRRFRKIEAAIQAPIVINPKVLPQNAVEPVKSTETDKLDTLLSQIILLNNMKAQLTTSFAGDPKAKQIRKIITDLVADIHKRATAMHDQMSKESRGKVSKNLVRLNHNLMKLLEIDLKKFFENMHEFYMISTISLPKSGEKVDAEIAYIRIDELKGADGYVHPKFFVIIAHPLAATKGAPMLIATTTEFRVPSRLSWDSTAKNGDELHRIVKDLLTQDGIFGRSVGFGRNIPVPQSRIKFSHENLKSTSVRGDDIIVRVKDPKKIDETRMELRGQLASIVRQVDPSNRDVIRDKLERDKGLIYFRFSLPKKLRGRLVSDERLLQLKKLLNADDVTLQRIKTAIENPD